MQPSNIYGSYGGSWDPSQNADHHGKVPITFGPDRGKWVDEDFISPWSQPGSSLSDAQRYAQQHGGQYGPAYMKVLEAYYTQHLAGRSPVHPERSTRLSDDIRMRAPSPERIDPLSTQSYESACNNGLRIPSDVLEELKRHGETPIESYTFINGIQLGASPTALPHYRTLRKVLQGLPGGPERIALIESPSKKEDLTLLVTTPHSISPYVVIPFVHSSAHQLIMHFDPFYGKFTPDGRRSSPMTICYHELEHVHQFLLVSRGDISQEYLLEEVDLYGKLQKRREKLAMQEENRLAEHLGQGVIHTYGGAGEWASRFRTTAFDSNIPISDHW